MRLVFFGTPDESVPALRALVDAGHDVALVVTQPDRRRGRGGATTPSPVKAAATALGLPVLTPRRSREVVDDVVASGAALGVVVAFGQLLPPALLDATPDGFVNVHFSLLPRWRGAAPVERAILAGDEETGVCIMALEAGLDTGPVYARARVPIGPDDTAGDVTRALVDAGTDLLVATLPDIATRVPEPQTGRPDLRRQAGRRGVPARRRVVDAGGVGAGRACGEPAARGVEHGAGCPGQGVARAGRRGRHVRPGGGAARGQGPHGCGRVDARPARAPTRVGDLMAAGSVPERKGGSVPERKGGSVPERKGGSVPERKGGSVRLLALDALVRIEDGAYAQVLVPEMLRSSNLDSRDRAFVTDLVYGTVRAQRRIDDLLGRVSKRPVRRLDRPVRAALRLGAYQLLQGVPAHAAVGETVDALAQRSPRARGFANGVLRGVTRIGPPWPEPDDPAVALSYPDWLIERLSTDLGEADAVAALTAMNEPAAVTLRPNQRVVTADALEAELRSLAIDVERGRLVPDALVVRGIGDPARLAAVAEGRATPQDQASQAVAALVDPRPGDRVADLAAAPGGKSTALAEQLADDGLVVAGDVDAGRLRLVATGAARLALSSVAPLVADARRPPFRVAAFDRVLLDAPCSGLGVLRRRPDARWRVTPETVDEVAALQRVLLAAAAALVRPGGTLVYSVCTLTNVETLAIDEWADGSAPGLRGPATSHRAVGAARARRAPAAPGRGDRRHVRARPPTRGMTPGTVRPMQSGSVPERKGGSVPERQSGSVPERETGSVKLAPSILSADFARLGADVDLVAAEADLLHVDVMDGHFVPNLTIGPPVVESLRRHTDLFLDCHLMVDNPQVLLADFAKAGADRCIVHVELGDPRPLFAQLRDLDVGVGLVLNPETPVDDVLPYLAEIDLLLVMSVHPGWGGQSFIPEVLDKIVVARAEIHAAGYPVEIEIDGGITVDTAPLAVAAGADILVAGSAIFGADDPASAARAIRAAGARALTAS